MTPGIKRLDHEAWPSLLALSVPIHDGKSEHDQNFLVPRVDTGGSFAHCCAVERKSRWDRKSVVPEEEPSRASRCAIPQGFSREATR